MNESEKESATRNGIMAALKRRGMTQRELAEKLGQHHVALNATIRNPNIQLGTLQRIADAIGCEVSEFFSSKPPTIVCPHCGQRLVVVLATEQQVATAAMDD